MRVSPAKTLMSRKDNRGKARLALDGLFQASQPDLSAFCRTNFAKVVPT